MKLTKSEVDFDFWFDVVAVSVLEKTGIKFRCEESVRDDYNSGSSAYCVADEIAAEYGV